MGSESDCHFRYCKSHHRLPSGALGEYLNKFRSDSEAERHPKWTLVTYSAQAVHSWPDRRQSLDMAPSPAFAMIHYCTPGLSVQNTPQRIVAPHSISHHTSPVLRGNDQANLFVKSVRLEKFNLIREGGSQWGKALLELFHNSWFVPLPPIIRSALDKWSSSVLRKLWFGRLANDDPLTQLRLLTTNFNFLTKTTTRKEGFVPLIMYQCEDGINHKQIVSTVIAGPAMQILFSIKDAHIW